MDNTNCILLRFGELFLKGGNRAYFESVLIKNIKSALKGFKFKFVKSQGRYYIEEFPNEDLEEIISLLTKVFGLYSLSPAYKIKTDIEEIKKLAVKISPAEGKFRVTVNRADASVNMRSMDIARDIGAEMFMSSNRLTVDLFNYDFELSVDMRENGFSYVFYKKIACAGGLPYGTGGRAVLLLSGGIDSPVSAYQMAKRGVIIHAVHYHSFPYTSELALQKVHDIAKKLAPYIPDMRLTVVPFTDIQTEIHKNCPSDFMITIMRRFMMRIAERVAKENGAGALITGESLGQVASQTIESINCTNAVVSLPVFRPLIGMDKEDIIAIAKKIDTYEISIRPHQDCCTVFLPKNPVIHPKLKDAEVYESKLDITALEDSALQKS